MSHLMACLLKHSVVWIPILKGVVLISVLLKINNEIGYLVYNKLLHCLIKLS